MESASEALISSTTEHVIDRSLPLPVGNERLRHGFMVSDVNRLALFAARRFRGYSPRLYAHQVEIAYHGMITRLYSSDAAPKSEELVAAAWRAMTDESAKDARFRGFNPSARYDGQIPSFDRYWFGTASPTPSPEQRIVERLALRQIFEKLNPRSQELLMALAEHGTYELAAETAGCSVASFTAMLSVARREFLALWHEGESPSRPWAQDKRKSPDANNQERAIHVIRRRKRAQELRPANPKPRQPSGRRKIDLGISSKELAQRYRSETIKDIAESLGVAPTTIHRRMVSAGIPRRDPGGKPSETATGRAEQEHHPQTSHPQEDEDK